MFDLFGESDLPIHDRLLKAYEHRDGWVNRLVLGDSLVVMNSLLHYEGLGGQVQTIYMDPPYAVKFGSNFQPFVRKRDVTHGADDDMPREPEMVQAYRDTWELGVHSFLTYLRDRLLLARELLHPSGSIFVQMSDTNLHHVREVMDEVFGAECFVSQISFQTTSGFQTRTLATLGDFLLWYARDPERLKVRKLFEEQPVVPGEGNARWVLLPDGSYRGVKAAEKRGEVPLPEDGRLYKPGDLQGQGAAREPQPFEFEGKVYKPGANSHWKPNYPDGLERLAATGRIHVAANSIQYRRFASDFPYKERGNLWTDTLTGSFTDEKMYVVQTNPKVVERCLLMTSDPGDLVLDPTCGSGTTAWCAEKWGRRWITCDTSRVPVALARQRMLTGTFDFFRLQEPERGPAGGFEYRRRQNRKGEEVGGIVPHITLESIANQEPAKEEVLVDRPEKDGAVTRISGPFCVEATIPTPVDWEGDGEEDSGDLAAADAYADHVERMIEVLRRSPVLHLGGGQRVSLSKVRRPARTMSLSAEALIEGEAEANGRHRLRPGERSGLGNAGVRSGPRGIRQGVRSTLRHRLRHPARRPAPDRELRPDGGRVRGLYPGQHGLGDGRPAQEPAVKPDLLGLRSAGRTHRAIGGRRVPGRASRPRRVRSGGDGLRSPGRERRSGLVPRHQLQWALLPRLSGFLSANIGVGGAQALASVRVRRQRVDASLGHCQRAFPRRRARPNCGQGR